MVVHVVNGATDLSHLTTLPVLPLNVNVPLVEPVQMSVPPVTLPPVDAGLTVTVVDVALSSGQTPLCTTARNWVVCVNAPDVYVVDVLLMVVQVVNGATELSHLTTLPVLPDNVNKPLVEPVQIAAPPLTVPPTDGALTVTVVVVELPSGQAPL